MTVPRERTTSEKLARLYLILVKLEDIERRPYDYLNEWLKDEEKSEINWFEPVKSFVDTARASTKARISEILGEQNL